MVSKISRILITVLCLAIGIAIIYLNPEHITVFLGREKSITAMGGIIYIGWFLLGSAVAMVFWVLYGIKAYFRERSLLAKGTQSHQFYQSMLDARGLLAAKEFARARERWKKLVAKDPTDIIARVELSRALQDSGEVSEALKVLDKARAADSTNTEVLLRAAEVNIALGNKTAAIDNLALVLYHSPNTYAAKLARDLSEELGRIEDAVEYNKQFETLGGSRDWAAYQRLTLQQLTNDCASDPIKEKIQKLRKFLVSNRYSLEATELLADLQVESGETVVKAVETLVKTLKECLSALGSNRSVEGSEVISSTVLKKGWRKIVSLYQAHLSPTEAVSSIKNTARSLSTSDAVRGPALGLRIRMTLDLARIELEANNFEGALETLQLISEDVKVNTCPGFQAGASKVELGTFDGVTYLSLKALALAKLNRTSEANAIWRKLAGLSKDNSSEALLLDAPGSSSNGSGGRKQPSPELSTP